MTEGLVLPSLSAFFRGKPFYPATTEARRVTCEIYGFKFGIQA